MSHKRQTVLSKRKLATFLLMWNVAEAQSNQDQSAMEVTSITTAEDSTITGIYTPTSISISGLAPPITAATTITTVDSAGDTVAVAVAAGAGAVAGGALAAWVFKPVPGAPPAPTQPPTFEADPEEDDGDNKPTTSSVEPTTFTTSKTSQASSACPMPTGKPISFAQAKDQPQWTVAIPSPSTVSSHAPKCTQQGENKELLRGTDPEYINALAQVFCEKDLSKDQTATLGQPDLDDDSRFKKDAWNGVRVKFGFSHSLTNDACKENCKDAYKQISTQCQYNSHVLYGAASLKQGCGDYSLTVDAEPNTKLKCNSVPDPIWTKYGHREAAKEAIKNFCGAQNGKVLQQGDESKDIKETTFSIKYASDCRGSGKYKIVEETCIKYLMETVDNCDHGTVVYKHGGTVTDTDNCAAFTYHPTGEDHFACYPKDKDANWAPAGGLKISPEMAKDAIEQFCDRQGDGENYTLDPDNTPDPESFAQDTSTARGMAESQFYYNNDGTRVDQTKEDGGAGNMKILIRAAYNNPQNFYTCGSNVTYAIQGDRCRQQLGKVIGVEPAGNCVGDDPEQLQLGSFVENGDKGCVMWTMSATKTM